MAQTKYTLYKYVRLKDDSWRYCRASLYANHTIKRDMVLVDGKEEKHPEGNYYIAHAGKWINVGDDALEAQRKQSRLLHGNMVGVSEHDKLKLGAIQSTLPDGRKEIKDEITAYLGAMVEAKRPEKSVRMNRNFLIAFADLIGKRFCDEYSREDIVKFRNKLLGNGYSRKYISTQMDFVLKFFRHHIGMPIQMKGGDHLEYATNLPEPYADQEIVAMERTAKGKFNLIVRLYRSTGCRLQEITHLHAKDLNQHRKTISIREKPCVDCPDCRARGGVWRPKTEAGTREIPISDSLVKEIQSLGNGLLFPDKHGQVEQHMLRELQRAVRGCGVPKVKMHRFRDTFAVNKLRDGVLLVREARGLVDLPTEGTDGQEQAARTLGVVDAACVDAKEIVEKLGREPTRLALAPRMRAVAHGKDAIRDVLSPRGSSARQQKVNDLQCYAPAGVDVDYLTARQVIHAAASKPTRAPRASR